MVLAQPQGHLANVPSHARCPPHAPQLLLAQHKPLLNILPLGIGARNEAVQMAAEMLDVLDRT